MIKFENLSMTGFESAIRGMRNPMNSWDKSDTVVTVDGSNCKLNIGPNDYKLMMSLAKAGPVDGKFRRMLVVYVDITAPLYWWKEFDTYKVGTVANSCSTMHKIHEKEFTIDDFSNENLISYDEDPLVLNNYPYVYCGGVQLLYLIVNVLNFYRKEYLEAKNDMTKDESERASLMKKYWWQMIQLLPSSYNQRRTVMLNYEVLANIYKHRKNHKLDEWRNMCEWIKGLPYSEIITLETNTRKTNVE